MQAAERAAGRRDKAEPASGASILMGSCEWRDPVRGLSGAEPPIPYAEARRWPQASDHADGVRAGRRRRRRLAGSLRTIRAARHCKRPAHRRTIGMTRTLGGNHISRSLLLRRWRGGPAWPRRAHTRLPSAPGAAPGYGGVSVASGVYGTGPAGYPIYRRPDRHGGGSARSRPPGQPGRPAMPTTFTHRRDRSRLTR